MQKLKSNETSQSIEIKKFHSNLRKKILNESGSQH